MLTEIEQQGLGKLQEFLETQGLEWLDDVTIDQQEYVNPIYYFTVRSVALNVRFRLQAQVHS